MKPLRLNLHTYVGSVLCILGWLALSLLGMFMMFNAPQVIQDTINDANSEESIGTIFYAIFYTIFSLGFTFGGLNGAYMLLVEEPMRVEFGPQFVYCSLTRTYTHEWADIESLQVTHTVHEDDVCYSLSASLIVTIADNKAINLGAKPVEKRDMIVRILVSGLNDDDPATRLRCAEALRKLRPDSLPDLQEEMKHMCETQRADFEQGAAQAKDRAAAFETFLNDAVHHLKTVSQDSDEGVRKAASEALRRWGRTATFPAANCDGGENSNTLLQT